MEKVDLRRLAKELNLSTSTVSRALTDCYEISFKTKERVLALAKELDYQPNVYAKSLKSNRSKTIAIVVPEIENSFFSTVLSGIEQELQKYGYHSLLYVSRECYNKEVEILTQLLNGRVDGVLISLTRETKNVSHILSIQSRIPVVLFDRINEEVKCLKVVTNDYESGHKAAQHLLKSGCKELVYVGVSDNLDIDKKRKEGFLSGFLNENSKSSCIYCSEKTEKGNLELIRTLLKSPTRPDGVFTSVESLAFMFYKVCKELHLNIPNDIKIISFSNSKGVDFFRPSLTTLTQPGHTIGKQAAEGLLNQLVDRTLSATDGIVYLPTKLIKRESSI